MKWKLFKEPCVCILAKSTIVKEFTPVIDDASVKAQLTMPRPIARLLVLILACANHLGCCREKQKAAMAF
jgi:hypothetical protein